MADARGQGLEAVKGGPANFQPERERPLKPTVFVGLGGTGLKVLARFRRRLYDRYGDADWWKIYQWLGIDADQGALSDGGVEKQKGLPLSGKDRLCTGMDPGAMKYVLDNLRGLYGHIGEWFRHDSIDVSAWSFLEGAGQNRVAGRVLFVKKIEEIRQALIGRMFEANSQTARDDALRKGAHFFDADAGGPDHLKLQAVDVVLVGSLAGGTGSGSFLDCAYLLQALQQEKAAPVGDVRGMFLLPDVFLGEVKQPQQREIIQANGYAALRELEFYNSGRANPFSTLAWGKAGQALREIRATPFANCYLFSLSNGRPLENAGEMYDLLADALSFSTGGGQLASKIRSCWSNAQSSVYSGRLVYRQFADATTGELHGAGEMGGDGENDGRTILYERTWSTRYSSMGTASLTMKLPELRRLAAVREVRRLLDMEVRQIIADADAARAEAQGRLAAAGHAAESPATASPADAATLQQTKQDAALFLGSRNLLKKLPSNVADRIARTAGANTAQEAEAGARTLLTLLHGIAAGVESASIPANNDAKMMAAEARNEATQTAHAAHATWSAGGNLAKLGGRLNRAAAALKAETPQPKASGAAAAALQIQSTPLEQWKDLDAHESGPLDLLFGGLEGRARRIIRPAFRDWLTAECDGYVRRIGTALQRHYLVQAAADLESLAGRSRGNLEDLRRTVNDEVVRIDAREKSEVAELEPWRSSLRQMQDDLTQQFHESRNTIISTDLAAKAADRPGEPKSDAEQKLDGQIDAVLDSPRFHGPHRTPAERLAAARRFALEHFATDESLPATPQTLLQAKRSHEARMGPRLLERLVDQVATKMLDDFPPTHDVFEALVARRTSNLTGAVLPAVMARAAAYWNLNTTIDQYKQTVQHTLLSGAVVAPGAAPLHERTEALEFLKQKHWDFYSPDQKEHGAEGELVLVHEAHGFALQSLVEIDQWKAAYDRVSKEGQQAARHLDYRVVPQLPELVAVDFPKAMDEVDSWDLALLGIVLGRFFKWSEKQSTFMYNPTGGQPLEVGPDYESIARWLRSAARYRRKLSADVDAWFTERAQSPGRGQTPEERSALARREAERLTLLGLVLDLLGKHCFKAIRAQPIDISPPPHTITVRLMARKVNRFLKILTDNYRELDRKALEADMVHQVQQHVQFVGPKAGGEGAGSVTTPSRSAPHDRILQLLPEGKENEDGGRAVLAEAFAEGWFEDAAVPENVKTLFPEYGEYAHTTVA